MLNDYLDEMDICSHFTKKKFRVRLPFRCKYESLPI